MPPTPSTLRIGEEITLTGDPKDADGNPIEGNSPAWSQAGTPDDIVTVTPAGISATVLGVSSGTDTVTLNAFDTFLNQISASQPITVLDASRLTFEAYDPVDCELKWVGDVLHVIPLASGPAEFGLRIRALDERTERGGPTYAVSDGPDLSTDNGILEFNGGNPTSDDDDEVTVDVVDSGDEVIHATAVTDATGVTITGTLNVRVRALTTVGPLIVS